MSRRAGFTLIELMVVMVLIAIMTAAILPAMKGTFDDALLRSTGRQLVTACELASSQAIAVNQTHRLRLDLKRGHYSIERRTGGREAGRGFVPVSNLPESEGPLDTRIRIAIGHSELAPAAGELPRSKPEGQSQRASEPAIKFYPDGTADALELKLQDPEGFELVLRINGTTGQVRINPGKPE